MKERKNTNKEPVTIDQAHQCRICHNDDLTYVGEKEGFRFFECSHCDYTFCPDVDNETLSSKYSSGWHSIEDGAPVQGWARSIRFLEPVFHRLGRKTGLTMLDFGTGQSFVPAVLREQGNRVIAVDLVPPIHPHPDRLTGNFMDLGLEPDQFDVVFSFQVFEHLPEPMPVFNELIRVTKPGGYVLIHTDMETPERGTDFINWWYVLPPDHCSYYKHHTFEVMLSDTPHEIVYKDSRRIVVRK